MKIIPAIRGLLNQTHPQVGGGGIGIAAVVNDNFTRHDTAVRRERIICVGEPRIRPRARLGDALRQGIIVKRLRGQIGGRDGVRDVVAIDEIRAVHFRPNFIRGPTAVAAHAVMLAIKHVQNRGANVLHELALERAAVVIFRAGRDVPEADIFAAGANAAPAPDMIHAEVGAVFVFVVVLTGVNTIRPQVTLHRCALHPDGGAAGHLHHAVALRVHAHPVEDGSGVNVVPAFAHAGSAIRATVIPNRRDVKSGGPARQGIMHFQNRIRLGRGAHRDLGIITTVARRVGD